MPLAARAGNKRLNARDCFRRITPSKTLWACAMQYGFDLGDQHGDAYEAYSRPVAALIAFVL